MAQDRSRRDAWRNRDDREDHSGRDWYGRDWETGVVRRFGPENYGGYGRGGVDYEVEGFQPVGGYIPEKRGGAGRRGMSGNPFDGVTGGEVTLNGFVESRAAKRRAEDVADHATEVTHVQNNLRVGTPGTTGATATAASAMAVRNRG